MGKLYVKGGSPLELQFKDDAGNPIDTITMNGTAINANRGWFTTDIDVGRRERNGERLGVFRVTGVGPSVATIEYRSLTK